MVRTGKLPGARVQGREAAQAVGESASAGAQGREAAQAVGDLASAGVEGAGRYAPSPSGDLHLGNFRTAVLAWLFAKHEGREFRMRIDDIDAQRSSEESAQQQLRDLAAMGITYDGVVGSQQKTWSEYEKALTTLRDKGLVYECYCSRKDIAEAVRAPHAAPGAYPGTCRDLGESERAEKRAELAARGRVPALRLRAGVDEWEVRERFAVGAAGSKASDDEALGSEGAGSESGGREGSSRQGAGSESESREGAGRKSSGSEGAGSESGGWEGLGRQGSGSESAGGVYRGVVDDMVLRRGGNAPKGAGGASGAGGPGGANGASGTGDAGGASGAGGAGGAGNAEVVNRDYAYNLAVVVDDALAGVGQVVRGDDLLSSAPRQAYLAHLLGLPTVEYVHVPLVLGPDGKRLAKRDGAVTLRDFPGGAEGMLRWIAESLGSAVDVELVGGNSPAELLRTFRPELLPRGPVTWTPAD